MWPKYRPFTVNNCVILQIIDGSTVDGPQFGERNGYTAKLSGYFVGPYDGRHIHIGQRLTNQIFSPRGCLLLPAYQ